MQNKKRVFRFSTVKSEANLTALLSYKLMELGYQVEIEKILSEIFYENGKKIKSNKTVAIFDIVIFRDKRPYIIIECKRQRKKNRNKKSLNKQISKYEEFGFIVITCMGINDLQKCIDNCVKIMNEKHRFVPINENYEIDESKRQFGCW